MLADLLSPIYLGPPGLLVCSVISLVGIILIEGTVLCLLRWGSWKIAFLHASIVNLVTSLLGTVLFMLAGKSIYEIPVPILLLGAFLLTVIVEAVELKALKLSAGVSRVVTNSLVANIFSYAFLGGMIFLALFPPVIGYRGRNGPYIRPTPFLSPGPSASPRT